MRIRKDASQAAPELQWYGKAFTRLKNERDRTTGLDLWTLQAKMHASIRVGTQTIECIHGSWFFLPWHRAYLTAFEAIVAQAVVLEGGPADWALPYWNYGNAATRNLPDAFLQPALPSNPLWVSGRNPRGPGSAEAESASCLRETSFSTRSGRFGFGGPPQGMIHTGGAAGACENQPHNAIHRAVSGVMATYDSPMDPIFWLHHCNIDRLWEVWRNLRRDAQGRPKDPTQPAWLDQPFRFLKFDGTPVSWTGRELLNTQQSLGYRYDPDPFAAPAPDVFRAAPTRGPVEEAPPEVEQMLGAADGPLVVHRQPLSVEIRTEAPEAPPSRTRFAEVAARGPQFYLRLENVRSPEGIPGTYAAYLNAGDAADPAAHPQLLAGLIPGFGIMEASANGGPGVTVSLEVTGVVNYLSRLGAWDPNLFRVSVVPYGDQTAPTGYAASPGLTIGKISFHIV